MITINNLQKYYGNKITLDIGSFNLRQGDVCVATGPSGAGKTTLAKVLVGLEDYQGQIHIKGKNLADYSIKERAQQIGMVFQDFGLWNNHTALENIMLAQVKVLGRSKEEAHKIALQQLEKVHMTVHLSKHPRELSGGQKQRIAIARTLAMNPEVIVLDEPTASLDRQNIKSAIANLKELAQQGTTMLIVTHDLEFAQKVSNRVVFMHSGKILEDVPTEKFFTNPETQEARELIAEM
ncbi:amino acid ABC transporter ATP-binding protein [Ralstonia mannitolilytica]|uniref:amino acid ABC transporter ATP-binding protein n=1 Tax=Ralstonia mannitolilytica TaxID=105219 RepID=UPI001C96BA11|nr:ATP-binding cassette domain-containing protein [Ralstonia mannitolilytica]MBY4717536.1 ATP-binding cassette domain-containing protein [Ralstonia mannitolilytica]